MQILLFARQPHTQSLPPLHLTVGWNAPAAWSPSPAAPYAAQVLAPRTGVALKATETAVRFRHVLAPRRPLPRSTSPTAPDPCFTVWEGNG